MADIKIGNVGRDAKVATEGSTINTTESAAPVDNRSAVQKGIGSVLTALSAIPGLGWLK
jgi:hypothetical protein